MFGYIIVNEVSGKHDATDEYHEGVDRQFLRNTNKVPDYTGSNPKRRQTLKFEFTLNYKTLKTACVCLESLYSAGYISTNKLKHPSQSAKAQAYT